MRSVRAVEEVDRAVGRDKAARRLVGPSQLALAKEFLVAHGELTAVGAGELLAQELKLLAEMSGLLGVERTRWNGVGHLVRQRPRNMARYAVGACAEVAGHVGVL